METKIAIIGAGNLGTSLVIGLVDSGSYTLSNFTLTRRSVSKLDDLKQKGFNVTANNNEAVSGANIIILAVLPQKIDAVLVGNEFLKVKSKYPTFQNTDKAIEFLNKKDFKNFTILLKGSRGIKLEKLIDTTIF